MGMKVNNINTVETWDTRNCNKNEMEGSVGVHISKPKKLNGRGYKELLISLAKRAKGSDFSNQKKNQLSQLEVNVTEPNGINEDETANADNCFLHSQRERKGLDFLLRRVRYSGHTERSNSSNQSTQTKKRKSKVSENQHNMDISKESAHCGEYVCKSTKTNFVEYWVPVRLSNVQTEQYCGTLFSNANVLRTSLKHDSTDILNEILVSTRKCCDHPYLVDRSLRSSLKPEQLDAEIKLSSKLLLLHKILLEIRQRGLRVLILYQSLGGSGPISTGDILDDIIHEKFGTDSFVRIGGGIPRSKRREALNTFNDKGSGKFVCLMETRACLPSTTLASIDTVIFFNSDWNPMNDLRALQKINLDSQFEQVKVFRLYSSFTVEEKLLILAKQGMSPEGIIINIKQSTCHQLLTWGASYLFEKLEEFHDLSTPDRNSVISCEDSSEDVFLELSNLMPNNEQSNICRNNSVIVEVKQIGGIYPRDISLLGEVEHRVMDNFALVEEMIVKEPHVFWMKLLEGRNPRWKYLPSQSPRIRKSVQRFEDLFEASGVPETGSKKCRTAEATNSVYQIRAIRRRRTRNRRPRQDKERNLSAISLGEYISVESNRRGNVTAWVNPQSEAAVPEYQQTPMLGNTSSAEPHSPLPPNGHDHSHGTTGRSFQTQAATQPLVEDSVRLFESSAIREVPVTRSEALNSVCKALHMELEKLQKQKADLLKLHEEKKLQIKLSCEEEIDQIRKKYDMLLQSDEMALVEEKEVLEGRYSKIYVNKSLAEAMMQMDNSENTALSQVTTNCSMEEISQLISQWPRSSTLMRPEQNAQYQPISRSNQFCGSSFPTVTHPVISSDLASCLPIGQSFNISNQTSIVARPDQPLATSLVQASVGRSILPFTFSGNLPTNNGLRAPAPHLRHTRHPLPITATKLSSPAPGIFLPVSLRPVTSNVQTLQSTGLSFCALSSLAGLPL